MSEYRKKPVVIEAEQWNQNGDHSLDGVSGNEGEIVRYFRHPAIEFEGRKDCKHCQGKYHDHGWIDTLEGGHIVCPGDWIIQGVQGEFYPCKPDIFAATYEAV